MVVSSQQEIADRKKIKKVVYTFRSESDKSLEVDLKPNGFELANPALPTCFVTVFDRGKKLCMETVSINQETTSVRNWSFAKTVNIVNTRPERKIPPPIPKHMISPQPQEPAKEAKPGFISFGQMVGIAVSILILILAIKTKLASTTNVDSADKAQESQGGYVNTNR